MFSGERRFEGGYKSGSSDMRDEAQRKDRHEKAVAFLRDLLETVESAGPDDFTLMSIYVLAFKDEPCEGEEGVAVEGYVAMNPDHIPALFEVSMKNLTSLDSAIRMDEEEERGGEGEAR